jgi:hypothetical protein|nr:MAG TPA: minor capsid protein [Caudoviricetes sp.]
MSLNDLEEQVERIYIDMENELLLNIAKKLSAGKPMEIDKWDEVNQQPLVGSGEVNEWQLQRLKELNGLNEENAKIIAKYSGKTVEEVNKVFDRAREIGMTRDETLIQEGIKLGILNAIEPDTEELLVRSILSNAVEEILTTFNKQNNSLLVSAGEEYRDIVNKVSSQVLAGTKTTNKAMQEAVSQLAEKGLTGFTARNGARWNPEAYTKMVIRSNTQNTINRIQDERIRSCGGDFIEVSSHIGARPLCSQDQGQVFSLSGYSGYIEDLDGSKVKVRAWSSSTYGKPAGIFGINCGHSRYMFVPGLSKKREMDFTKAENDEAYIEKQRQRQYERTIRNKKREIAMLKQTGAEDSYIRMKQSGLSNIRKEYLDFLDKTGRTRITANEWIGSTSLSPKTVRKTRNNLEKNIFGKSIDYSKLDLSNKKVQELKKDLDNLTRKYNTRLNSVIIKSRKEMRASGTVDIAGNMELSQIRKTTVYHEFFHSISQTRLVEYDLGNKYDKQFWEEANKLFKNYKKEINYLQKNNPLKIYDIKISDYSLTNVDEFMAEGFARAMLEKTGEIAKDLAYNSEKMSPYAIKILDLINKYYKK